MFLYLKQSSILQRFVRLPDIVVGGLIFYRDSSSSFDTYPLSSLNETQPKSATWSEVSAI